MNNILLFGGGLQSLSIARGLKDKGYKVFNMADGHSVGRFSNFIDKFESIDLESIESLSMINKIVHDQIDVIIPMEDEYAEWLSINQKVIAKKTQCKIAITNPEVFSTAIDKQKLLTVCENYNIPHPRTITINSDNIDKIKKFEFPALIKPNISNGSRGISLALNYNDFKNKIKLIIQNFGACTLQEYIQNDHYYNVMLYRYQDGSYGPSVATKISRFYPIKGGSSSFCTTINDPRLFNICKTLLTKLNWFGFADFDVLEKNDGDYKIIELNPRVPASVHAAYISGINYGEVIINDLLNCQKTSMTYYPGKHLRCLGIDIAWFLTSPRRFKIHPSWFKFWGKNLFYQEGGYKDLRAMAYSICMGIKKQLSPSFRKAKSGMN